MRRASAQGGRHPKGSSIGSSVGLSRRIPEPCKAPRPLGTGHSELTLERWGCSCGPMGSAQEEAAGRPGLSQGTCTSPPCLAPSCASGCPEAWAVFFLCTPPLPLQAATQQFSLHFFNEAQSLWIIEGQI